MNIFNCRLKMALMLHVCYIHIFINSVSASRVVVAGNEDALRSLAQRFAPQNLLNRLASYVQNPPPPVYDDNDYANPNEGQGQDQAYVNSNAFANAAVDPVMNPGVNPVNPAEAANTPDYPVIAPFAAEAPVEDYSQQTTKFRQSAVNPVTRKPPLQVNLDELVEKVKDRLMAELKTSSDVLTTEAKPRIKASNKPKAPIAAARPVPQVAPQFSQQAAPQPDYEEPIIVPKSQSVPSVSRKPRPPPMIVNGPAQNKPRKPAGVLVEKSDHYDKFVLSKKKGHKDSYEEYVTPKKEADIFESEEVNDKMVKRMEFSKEIAGKPGQEQRRVTVKRKEVKPDLDGPVSAKNNAFKRITVATPNNFDPKNKASSIAPSSKVEYVDDDYYTKVTTTLHEPKALTEFIGMDSKEELGPVVVETTSEPGRGRKKVPRKIVTNMPTKSRFTMCTPNYYENLPRIAEKYNFDEPIPERDREEEDLKAFPTAEAHINGKVKSR